MIKNYNILNILTDTQEDIMERLRHFGMNEIEGVGFMYTPPISDELPLPMLCVHLDTINTHRSKVKPTKEHFNFVSSTNSFHLSNKGRKELACLGGDDRAGLWIALRLIEWMETNNKFNYRIGFFIDEEIGCVGSNNFNDIYNTTCYIGLDRRSYKGRNEVALYGYDNEELINIFTDLGYKKEMGSVTDASTIASYYDVACVNISVGYDNEHTKDEVLYLDAMYETLHILKNLPKLDYKFESLPFEIYDYDFNYYDIDEDYVIDLELKNEILEEALTAMGMDIDDILEQGGYYEISATKS